MEDREGRTSRVGTFRERTGIAEQVADVAQDVFERVASAAYKQAADATRKVAGAAYDQTAGKFDHRLRNTIKTKPYTTILIAFGVGWLLGRTHRPM
jgi:ElaB/YqjD/DUF883 family membrane-anchored ribosome-binding protein